MISDWFSHVRLMLFMFLINHIQSCKINVVYKLCFLYFASQFYFPILDYQASNWIKRNSSITRKLLETCIHNTTMRAAKKLVGVNDYTQINMAGESTYQHGTYFKYLIVDFAQAWEGVEGGYGSEMPIQSPLNG